MAASAHLSALQRWRARRLSEQARATFDRPPVADDSTGVLRTAVVGRDPIRILAFGSGPLIGYGVRTRKQAVDGHLAELVAESTGRGVIVESRVRLALPMADAVESLGGAGTTTFAVAVWAPRFGEELLFGDVARCRTAIRAMLQRFRSQSPVPLVVCHLPDPHGLDWRTAMRRPRVAGFNRILAEESRAVPEVEDVAIGGYHPADAGSTGSPWHRGVAERLTPAVLRAVLPHHEPGSPGAAPRTEEPPRASSPVRPG